VLTKIRTAIVQSAKNPDLKDVILSKAKNLLFFFLIKESKDEILRPSASG
jgi:hypothetical protein